MCTPRDRKKTYDDAIKHVNKIKKRNLKALKMANKQIQDLLQNTVMEVQKKGAIYQQKAYEDKLDKLVNPGGKWNEDTFKMKSAGNVQDFLV